MKKGLIGTLMTVIGALLAAWFGYNWYTQAAGIWTKYAEDGSVKGYGYAVALTIVAVLIVAAGIVLLVRNAKEKKSK